jgi:lipopolysaccharide assembly protein B
MNGLLYLVLLLALAIGWWLGRYGLPSWSLSWRRPRTKEYLKGLTYLINEQSDAAVDTFLAQLDVNPKTLEMHIAIGSMLRRKGELDRAIRIHQNILESQALSAKELSLAQLELARDFYSAGILDRVETILLDMVRHGSRYQIEAHQLLLNVYRDLQQWQDALDCAVTLRRLMSSSSEIKVLSEAMGHYCCELALEAIEAQQPQRAEKHLDDALTYDPNCVRATILAATLATGNVDIDAAKQRLFKIVEQDISLFSEAINVLATMPVDEETLSVVKHAHHQYPSLSAFKYMLAATHARDGEQAVQHFLQDEVAARPSITALDGYLEFQPVGKTHQEVRGVVRQTLQRILSRRDRYVCRHCGFRCHQMHWLCPKCKRWGDIRQRYGL